MTADLIHILISVLIGAVAGFLASRIMGSKGGLLRNIIMGIIGGIVGSFLLGLIGISGSGYLGTIIVSVVGACIVIAIGRLLFK
jgi:uncharacterized membrane protein YeaQ/YmgE (transglycosylase-associated protein family)